MIRQINKSMTYSATAVIVKDNKDVDVAYMSGNVSGNDKMTIDYTIVDRKLFDENKEEIEADIESFKREVIDGE